MLTKAGQSSDLWYGQSLVCLHVIRPRHMTTVAYMLLYIHKTLPTIAEQTLLLSDSHTWLGKHDCLATEVVSMIYENKSLLTYTLPCANVHDWYYSIWYDIVISQSCHGGIPWRKFVQICTLDQIADEVLIRPTTLLSGNLLFCATNLRNSYTRDAEQVGIGAIGI